jgi:cell division protein FtsB
MAPTAAPARARRAPAPSAAPSASPSRRPPLRVVGPRRRPPARRRALALAVGGAVASLLAVGGAQAYLVQGQVRLARLQQQLTTAQSEQRSLEVQVARLEDPSNVVSQAERQGLSVPSQVTDLPLVGNSAPSGTAPGR